MAANSPVPTLYNVGRGAHLYVWDMLDDSTGVAVQVPGASDKSIQAYGTFSSATITVEGSNSPTDSGTYATLTDVDTTTATTFAAAGLYQIEENTVWIRPVESGGAGSVAVTVALLVVGR